MRVLIDTSVWSLALRRRKPPVGSETTDLAELIREGRAVLIGPVRQEILSGIRETLQFDRLEIALAAFPDEPLHTEDYVEAARISNRCLKAGYVMGNTDSLIAAVALRGSFEIFSTDKDFQHAARGVPIRLFHPVRP